MDNFLQPYVPHKELEEMSEVIVCVFDDVLEIYVNEIILYLQKELIIFVIIMYYHFYVHNLFTKSLDVN